MDTFRDTLTGLLRRPDVKAVYAQIYEFDPGEGCWPFTDTVIVVGSISLDDLRSAVSALEPSEVATTEQFGVSPPIAKKHPAPALVVWWD
jgi:hypothetical protein